MPTRDRGDDRRTFLRHSTAGAAAGVLVGLTPAGGAAAGGPPAPAPPGVYDARAFGARGDGAADDTAALQAAIRAAGDAGGGVVYLPPGAYRTTAGLVCRAHHVVVQGAGGASVGRAAGAFDTLRFAGPGPGQIYRNRVADLLFDERGKTGGRTLVGDHVAQLVVERVVGDTGWDGYHFHNFNHVTLTDCRFDSYRGSRYGRATGGGPGGGRSDVLRLTGVSHGGARTAGIVGLDVDGFVHTVNGVGVYFVAVGGRCLWARNSVGAERGPGFFTFDDLECDYPDGECVRLDAGEHFYFTAPMVHATRGPAPNVYVGPGVTGVSITGGFSTGGREAGLRVEGRDVCVTGVHFHANSSPEFGGARGAHPGVHLGPSARDVVVTGCRSGRADLAGDQSAGCRIDPGADGFVVVGNDFRHNAGPGVDNAAGAGAAGVVANNLG